MKSSTMGKRTSAMAMAIAIATGAVIATGTLVAEPAYAQNKKKKKKAQYSKEFVAAYTPVNDAFKAEGSDVNALKPQLLALAPLAKSPDEQIAAGGLLYNAAVRIKDPVMQLQGMEMMIASGLVPITAIGQYNFIAYQLATQAEDFPKARTYLQNAINANFSTAEIPASELQVAMAESFISEERYKEGLDYLSQAISARKNMKQPVDERWYRRGLSVAYQNDILSEIPKFTYGWVSEFPTEENWREAINVMRNKNDYESPEMLDLLRLGAKIGTIDNQQDVSIFVESADARRLPLEVKNLIEKAYAEGFANRDNIYLADALSTAKQRIPTDRAELPEIQAEADAAGADLPTVMAAADVFLSYGDYAKAEGYYAKALNMPGAETALVLTRLGMAQVWQGKTDEATATLAKVTGNREGIAMLWTAYAESQNKPASLSEILGG